MSPVIPPAYPPLTTPYVTQAALVARALHMIDAIYPCPKFRDEHDAAEAEINRLRATGTIEQQIDALFAFVANLEESK